MQYKSFLLNILQKYSLKRHMHLLGIGRPGCGQNNREKKKEKRKGKTINTGLDRVQH